MKKQKAIFTKGIPASGKSTWSKKFVKDNQDYKRINRDSLRFMLSDYTFNNKNEDLVSKLEKKIIKDIIESNYNIVIDNMNLNKKILNQNIKYLKSLNKDIEIEIKEFEVTLEEAILRDAKRDFSIGEKVIREKYFQYIHKEIGPDDMIKYDESLPDAIIVDVDGTIAHKGDRSPFDFKKVGEDKPKWDIIELVDILRSGIKDLDVFIFSGRDDSCFDETEKWLDDHGIIFDSLHMRKAKDNRKDSIVKIEMYEEFIKNKFNVLYVIDDRKQVVDMWRSLNLTCLDVAGNIF